MYDPYNADGETKADQSANTSSKLNKLQSIDLYEHSIIRRQRPIEHQKPKPSKKLRKQYFCFFYLSGINNFNIPPKLSV